MELTKQDKKHIQEQVDPVSFFADANNRDE